MVVLSEKGWERISEWELFHKSSIFVKSESEREGISEASVNSSISSWFVKFGSTVQILLTANENNIAACPIVLSFSLYKMAYKLC